MLDKFENKINTYEEILETKISFKEKEKILSFLKKLEFVIDDFKINYTSKKTEKRFLNYLNKVDIYFDKLIKNEQSNIKFSMVELEFNKFLQDYKKIAYKNSNFLDNMEGYYLGVKQGLIKVSDYVKNDISALIDFFSDFKNIKKLPHLIYFIFENFDKIVDNVLDKSKQELYDIKNNLQALISLHSKGEISDKLFNYKFISIGIYLVGIVIYEFLPADKLLKLGKTGKFVEGLSLLKGKYTRFIKYSDVEKIDKIEKIEDLEKVILEGLDKCLYKQKKIIIDVNNVNKREIHYILSKNFPLLNVTRLGLRSKIVNFNFKGIKQLNDVFGQKNVDVLINLIKDDLQEQLGSNLGRLIRNDYKNLTLEIKSDNFSLRMPSIEKLIKENKSKFEFNNIKLSNDKVVNIDINEFIDLSKKNVDVGAGFSIVKGSSLKSKLKALYEAEIASKKSIKLEKNIFLKEEILKKADKVVNIENTILKSFKGKQFVCNGYTYDIVVKDLNNEDIINPILLRYIRKGKKILNVDGKDYKKLEQLTQRYINNLNNGFDFIAPYYKFSQDAKIAKKINTQIRIGRVDLDYFIKNFKGSIPKDVFFNYVRNKGGSLYFVDIKDMGIMNFEEFRLLAHKLVKGRKVDLTSAGKVTTSKFVNFVKKLQKKYPDCKISIGGDEIYIYSANIKNIENDINDLLKLNRLKGRITKFYGRIGKNTINVLDKNTKLIKKIEEHIDGLGINNIQNIVLKDNFVDLSNSKITIHSQKLSKLSSSYEIIGKIDDEKKIYGKLDKGLLHLTLTNETK